MVYMWSEDNSWELVLSFYHAGPGDSSQDVRLGGQHFYPWSCLAIFYLPLLYKGVSLGNECTAQLFSQRENIVRETMRNRLEYGLDCGTANFDGQLDWVSGMEVTGLSTTHCVCEWIFRENRLWWPRPHLWLTPLMVGQWRWWHCGRQDVIGGRHAFAGNS